jgi:hypothetical protein
MEPSLSSTGDAYLEKRKEAHDRILVMNEQGARRATWPKGGCPERFVIAVEKQDFEAIRITLPQVLDLSIEAL